MKTDELMVGDWVACKELFTSHGLQRPRILGQITQIKEDNRVEFAYRDRWQNRVYIGLKTDEVEPIPLTAEILEKNGFEHNPHKESHFYFDDEFVEVDIHEMSDSVWLIEAEELEFSMSTQRAIVCNVHELQHAIKLYGIDKEIVL